MTESGKNLNPPGPDPERLKLDGDWEDAIGDALKKKRPENGWPDGEEAESDREGDSPDDDSS